MTESAHAEPAEAPPPDATAPAASSDDRRRLHLIALAVVLVLIGAARARLAWWSPSAISPDEVFQTVEQGFRIVHGRGVVPWEFREGLRSWVFPGFLAAVLAVGDLVGPAGFVSMEDGEAIEVVQKATRSAADACAIVEMGGRGPLRDLAHRVTETPIRGFWSYWAELMGAEPEGAIR